MAARQYREDLYFRLSVFPILIPPLRERPGDIALLARYFVERFCREMQKPVLPLAPDAIDAMQAYPWRGNVRELQNCIERAVILTDADAIHARHLNLVSQLDQASAAEAGPADPWDAIDLNGSLAEASRRVIAEVERRKITRALAEANGNVGRAAEILQVSYKSLVQKTRDLGLA